MTTSSGRARGPAPDNVDRLLANNRLADATALARSAVVEEEVDGELAARLHLLLSTMSFLAAEDGAVDEADAALELVERCGLPAELAVAGRLARLLGLLAEDRIDEARRQANAILAGGDRQGVDAALTGALTALAILAWNEGRVADALDLVDAAVQRADRGPDEARRMHPRLVLAPMLIATGELAAAARCIEDAEREIAEVGDVLWETAPRMFSASLAVAAGRLDEALEAAQDAISDAEDVGARLLLVLGRGTCAAVALLRGDIDEAERQARRGRADDCPQLGYGSAQLIWIESRIAEARGGRDAAAAAAADVLARPHAHRRLLVEEPAGAVWFTRLALAAGDRRAATSIVACIERLALDNRGGGAVEIAAVHARALLDGDLAGLDRAAAGHRRSWARGSAAEDAGVLLAAAGHEDARCRFDSALEAYREAGASRDVDRVRRRIRRLVASHRRAGRPLEGWASLTAAEVRVSELVARGLTNSQVGVELFVSRHTVDFHLRHVYRKLGIGSRVELTRLAVEHGVR